MPPCWSTVSAPMPTDLSACSTSRPCWHSGAGCRVTANGTADRRLVDALGRRFQPPRRSADVGAGTIVGGGRGVLDPCGPVGCGGHLDERPARRPRRGGTATLGPRRGRPCLLYTSDAADEEDSV